MWQKQLSYHLTVLREGINSLQLSLPCPTNTSTAFSLKECHANRSRRICFCLMTSKGDSSAPNPRWGLRSRVHRELRPVGAKTTKNFCDLIHLVLPNVEFAN